MLLIGTLYCAKGNYEFGISRVIKSLEPYNKKLGTDTWFYAKRCFLSLIENLAKHMISVRDSVIQVNYGRILIIGAAMYLNMSIIWIKLNLSFLILGMHSILGALRNLWKNCQNCYWAATWRNTITPRKEYCNLRSKIA